MRKPFAQLALLICLLGVLLVPSSITQGQTQDLSATFFVAHAGSHEDASVVPIAVVGGRPVTFEVRVRDAGTTPKGGWQTRLILDACWFETPAVEDISFGDYLAPAPLIPVGPKIEQVGNVIRIDQGQVGLSDYTTAPSGLLATITVTARPRAACPDTGATPSEEATVAFDLAMLGAPGGVKYDVTALDGLFAILADGARKVFLPLVTRN